MNGENGVGTVKKVEIWFYSQ